MQIPYIEHKFRPSETIDAVMRLKGRHNYTREELVALRAMFNELNGPSVPRVGQTFKIPLLRDVIPVEVPVELSPAGDGEQPPEDQRDATEPQQVDGIPPEPVAEPRPEDGPEEEWYEEVPPDLREDPGEHVQKEDEQPGPQLEPHIALLLKQLLS